jgi:hypothetical protein
MRLTFFYACLSRAIEFSLDGTLSQINTHLCNLERLFSVFFLRGLKRWSALQEIANIHDYLPSAAQPFDTKRVSHADMSSLTEVTMKVDLFRRPEAGGQYSYLAVPQGRLIPQEATNTDWETLQPDIDLERQDEKQTGLYADDATEQIDEKGYAISSVKNLAGNNRVNEQ